MVNKVSKIGVFTPPKYPQFSSSRSLISPPNTKYICLKAATKTAQNGVFFCHRKQNRGRSWALPYIFFPFNSRQVSQAEEVTVTIFQAGPVRHEGGTHRPSQQPPPAPQPTIRHYRRLRPERETQTPGRAWGGSGWGGGGRGGRRAARPPHPPPRRRRCRRREQPPPPGRHPAARGRGPEAGGPRRARLAGRTAEPADARPSLGDGGDVCPYHKKNNKLHNK